jgi:hypothetical protein
MRRFAAAMLCLVGIGLGGCATRDANANRVIACTTGSDCDDKWSRAMQWLQQNSSSKVTVTDTQLTTAESLDAAKPAFEVTKVAQPDGQSYQITMRAWCAAGNCDDLAARLRTSFNDYVLAR